MRGLSVGALVLSTGLLATTLHAAEAPEGITVAQQHVLEADIKAGPVGLLAPGTKVPKIGPDASELDYVKWALSSLDRGQTAEAEVSLEWGQVRRRIDEEEAALQDRQPPPPYDKYCLRMLCKAMQSIGKGDGSTAKPYLVTAISDITARTARPKS